MTIILELTDTVFKGHVIVTPGREEDHWEWAPSLEAFRIMAVTLARLEKLLEHHKWLHTTP